MLPVERTSRKHVPKHKKNRHRHKHVRKGDQLDTRAKNHREFGLTEDENGFRPLNEI